MNRTVWAIGIVSCLPIVMVTGALLRIRSSAKPQETFQYPPLGAAPADAALAKGYGLFTSKGCVYCHGAEGKGGTKNPNAMGGEVPSIKIQNFTVDEFVEKLSVGVRHVDVADPKKAEPPLYMPSWKGKLTEEDMKAVYAYLKSFAPKGNGDEW